MRKNRIPNKYNVNDIVYHNNIKCTILKKTYYDFRDEWGYEVGFDFTHNTCEYNDELLKSECDNELCPKYKIGDEVMYEGEKYNVSNVFYSDDENCFGYVLGFQWRIKECSINKI